MNIIDVTEKIPICNYSKGRIDRATGKTYLPEGVVLHITADSKRGQAVSHFKNPVSGVSANYVIEKNGDIFKCVDPLNKAYHCGEVHEPTAKIYYDKGSVNPNLYLIGVECVSSGEPLTIEQYTSLMWLLKELNDTFNIVLDRYHVIGHYELDSVTRKNDPVASYSVDEVMKDLGVINLNWKEILGKVSSNPADWEKAITTAQNAAKADGSLGGLEIFAFLPQLIEKIYNTK